MTIFIGGMGTISIYRALKDKIIFSKNELFKKEEYYTPFQMFVGGFFLLGISLWYDFYKGNMFEYIKKVQILSNQSKIDFEIMSIVPILAVSIVFLFFIGMNFQKSYAKKNNNMYIVEYTIADKISGILFAIIAYALIIFVNSKGISYQAIIFSSLFVFAIIFFSLKVIFFKITFNEEFIELHTFWRAKKIIQWTDVKSIRFEEKNNEYIRLTTKDNKKFIISARLNGLVSFMSTYKTRNKKVK
ncbi:MAG: hypothetical protein L3J43_11745 [Sulfurovum sp.]|nr:hypothetical protein [Sulfurovum sp.]